MRWIFMQNVQWVFNCTDILVLYIFLDKNWKFWHITCLLTTNCCKVINSQKQSSFLAHPVSPVWAPGRNASFVRFLISALYILFACLYHMFPHLSFYMHLSPPFLIFSYENRLTPFPYQAKRLARGKCLWNDLFCVEWEVSHNTVSQWPTL